MSYIEKASYPIRKYSKLPHNAKVNNEEIHISSFFVSEVAGRLLFSSGSESKPETAGFSGLV
ncbi:hypothetical protein P4S72_05340 [Vibrio sp. PP-XX7]